jgi:hypothetical protein
VLGDGRTPYVWIAELHGPVGADVFQEEPQQALAILVRPEELASNISNFSGVSIKRSQASSPLQARPSFLMSHRVAVIA